jgi:hypothetical protein
MISAGCIRAATGAKSARESLGDQSSGGRDSSLSKIPVCSTTRVKSAIVLSMMIDGSSGNNHMGARAERAAAGS